MFRIQKLSATPSTNEDAKAAALAGEVEGHVIQAEQQTAGKGRQGRVWESPAGNLYCSILLRPQCDVQQAGHYSFIAALAVRAVLAELLPAAHVQMKWPNDILVNDRKVSGILLEAAPLADSKIEWLVLGIGVNCRFQPEATPYPTSSLKAEGAQVTEPDDVLSLLLGQLEGWIASYRQHGFGVIRSAWLHHAKRGPLTARLPQATLQGDFVDLDPHGRLIIRLADGEEQAIAAADIFFSNSQ